MKKVFSGLLAALLIVSVFFPNLLLGKAAAAEPEKVLIAPDMDLFTDTDVASNTTITFKDGVVEPGVDHMLFAGYNFYEGYGGPQQAAFRFHLGTVTRAIQSVALVIPVHEASAHTHAPYIDVYGSDDDSWADQDQVLLPSADVLIASKVEGFQGNTTRKIDVSSYVNEQITSGDNQISLLLRGPMSIPPGVEGDYYPYISFYDTSNTSQQHVALEITYAPNSPPANIQLTPNVIEENRPSGSLVGTLSAEDPDGDPFTFKLVTHTDLFEISGNQLYTKQMFNREATASYDVTVAAVDSNGLSAEKKLTITVADVNEPPLASFQINGGATTTQSAQVALQITATDPESDALSISLSNNNLTWSAWEALAAQKQWTLASGDGAKTVYLKVKDTANNEISTQQTITLDTTPPTGSFTINNDTLLTNTTNVTLQIDVADATENGTEMRFSNDNSNWSQWEPYLSQKAWTLSAGDGEKTVYMQLRDQAANLFSATDTIRLDTTRPVVSGVSDGQTLAGDVVILFDEGTATLNGTAFTSGTKVEAEGNYTLRVTDGAGNETEIRFAIDKTAPAGKLVINQDDGYTNALNAELTITFHDLASSVEMRLANEGEDWTEWRPAAATAPWTLTSGDGSKTVMLELRDGAGNISSYTDSIVLDTLPPVGEVQIDQNATYTNSRSVALTLSHSFDTSPLTVRFSNDGNDGNDWSEWAELSETVQWTLSAGDGEKTVQMELRDAAGNITRTSDKIELDQTPPVVSGITDNQTVNADPTITFSEGTATLDGTEFLSGTTVSEEGTHTLIVTDPAQNKTTVRFTLDKSAPSAGIVINDDADYTSSPTVSLRFVTNDDQTGLQMRLSNDGSNWSSWETFRQEKSWELDDGSGFGERFVYLEIRDAAGNTASAHDSIMLDRHPPQGTLQINENAARTQTTNVTLQIAATDESGSIEMRFSNDQTSWKPWQPLQATSAWQLEQADGTKTVYLELRDRAGNLAVVSDSIELDAASPVVNGVTDGEIYQEAPTITFNEGTASLDGKAFENGNAVTEEGEHTLVVTDAAGNQTKIVFTLDKTAPTGSLTINNGAATTTTVNVTLQISANDNLTAVQMRFSNDNQTWSTWEPLSATKKWQLEKQSGDQTVYLELRDQAGNRTGVNASIIYRPTSPTPPPSTQPVADVSLNETELTLQTGKTYRLRATVTPANASNPAVTWESSDPEVAEVNADGSVTAKRAGTAVITVRTVEGGKTDTCEITVIEPSSSHLEASADFLLIKPKRTVTFQIYYVSGEKRINITKDKDTSYQTEDDLVTVRSGQIRAGAKEGEETITASYKGEELTLSVTVSSVTVKKLRPSTKETVLEEGDERAYRVEATYSDKSSDDVTKLAEWSSSNPDVLEVNEEGEVIAKQSGTAVITVRYGGKKAAIRALVVKEAKPKKLDAERSSLQLKPDEEEQVAVNAVYEKGYEEEIAAEAEWESEDAQIVSVSKGEFTAKSPGRTKVSARYKGREITFTVTVAKPAVKSLQASEKQMVLEEDDERQLHVKAAFADHSSEEVTAEADWSSSDEDVVEVSEAGEVTAKKNGEAVVTAEYEGERAEIEILVVGDKAPAELQVDRSIQLAIDESETVQVLADYKRGYELDVTKQAEWRSADETIATVRKGKIEAIAEGETEITVSYRGLTETIKVKVRT
ncbi:cadherin repeat domain-containing protein [Brevibacillus fulvus]|uniref:Uncharacterized protein YjdB n=1 Tax=Brevibacillus fulvus TaxID=1125967 RepID=A0A939BWE2_9BACL|nr:cadherin repeat domain-containing protein [Brevibacillus fulvus]MBM7591721.1 uncharacterized protein YjdB [Brevibacillus fulvus]